MKLTLPPPTIPGISDGELDLSKHYPVRITVGYPKIGKPHTVSVLWHIYGPVSRVAYFCKMVEVAADADYAIEFTANADYAGPLSIGQNVTVTYSVSIEGEPPLSSEQLKFKATHPSQSPPPIYLSPPPPPAVRENMNQPMIGAVDVIALSTQTIGTHARVAADWYGRESERSTMELVWHSSDHTEIWRSAPEPVSMPQMLLFKLPKSEILKCKGSVGFLVMEYPPGSGVENSGTLTVFVDTDSKYKAWSAEHHKKT